MGLGIHGVWLFVQANPSKVTHKIYNTEVKMTEFVVL